jgi:SHS2 domain-containing protein
VAYEIRVRGATLQQAFTEAALQVFALAVDPAVVRPSEVREVRAHGSSLGALLGQWIAECSYVHEIEGFACHAIEFAVFDVDPSAGAEPMRLHAFLYGEAVSPERLPLGEAKPVVVAEDSPIGAIAGGYEIHLTVQD